MSEPTVKKVRILERVGDPKSGVILQPGALVDLPEYWADKYIAQGKAREDLPKAAKAEKEPEAPKAAAKKPAAKGKKK